MATEQRTRRAAPYRPEGHTGGLPEADGAPPDGRFDVVQPTLGPLGWLRWVWRQLTSMRVALLLLALLAVAALPGSFLPQRPQAPERVVQYLADNPQVGPVLDRLGFFDVYASPWFSAIYLTLFLSLVGCIVPRVAAYARALRAEPPRVPRSFTRFPVRDEVEVDLPPERAQEVALAALRRRYRARAGAEAATGALTVRAERGYLREAGNLVFHLALVGVLVGVALGTLFGYRGQVLVVEGRGFANAVLSYDSFTPGVWFRDEALEPFSLTLDQFGAAFDPATLRPEDFAAAVSVAEPDGPQREAVVRVNHPLTVGGSRIYLAGNGYAPVVTVRDGAGEVAFSGPVPFLPQDGAYTSRGVVKVPDVTPSHPQLGFAGFFLPTAAIEGEEAWSAFPQPLDPVLVLTAYAGDLGLDSGIPQNVYELDTTGMSLVTTEGVLGPADSAEASAAEELTLLLEPGQTVELPDGLGSVTFEDLRRFAALDLRHDPMAEAVLVFSLLAIAGLATSLFVPRRRMWVRLTPGAPGRTVVAAAALARGEDPGLRTDLERVVDAVRRTPGETT